MLWRPIEKKNHHNTKTKTQTCFIKIKAMKGEDNTLRPPKLKAYTGNPKTQKSKIKETHES
jgi:hypothetical protein